MWRRRETCPWSGDCQRKAPGHDARHARCSRNWRDGKRVSTRHPPAADGPAGRDDPPAVLSIHPSSAHAYTAGTDHGARSQRGATGQWTASAHPPPRPHGLNRVEECGKQFHAGCCPPQRPTLPLTDRRPGWRIFCGWKGWLRSPHCSAAWQSPLRAASAATAGWRTAWARWGLGVAARNTLQHMPGLSGQRQVVWPGLTGQGHPGHGGDVLDQSWFGTTTP